MSTMLFLPLETGCKTIPESGCSVKEEAKVDKRSVSTEYHAHCIAKLCTPVEIPSGRPSILHILHCRDPENFTCLSCTF